MLWVELQALAHGRLSCSHIPPHCRLLALAPVPLQLTSLTMPPLPFFTLPHTSGSPASFLEDISKWAHCPSISPPGSPSVFYNSIIHTEDPSNFLTLSIWNSSPVPPTHTEVAPLNLSLPAAAQPSFHNLNFKHPALWPPPPDFAAHSFQTPVILQPTGANNLVS